MTEPFQLLCILTLATPAFLVAQTPDQTTFIIRRGSDTVATEQVAHTTTEIQGTLLLHSGRQTTYHAVLAPDATVPLIEVTVRQTSDNGKVKEKVAQRTRIIFKDDSVSVDDITGNGLATLVMQTERGALPYLNLSFGLLEQVVRRANSLGKGNAEVAFFNLGSVDRHGGQTAKATVSRVGADSVSVAIGAVEFRLQVDSSGRLLGGGIPAQQLSFVRAAGS